jgi:hypothetical protein
MSHDVSCPEIDDLRDVLIVTIATLSYKRDRAPTAASRQNPPLRISVQRDWALGDRPAGLRKLASWGGSSERHFMACFNPGHDEQRRSVATTPRRVADYGLPLGLHPGATPAVPVVQESLILRGFFEAILRWRRGRDSQLLSGTLEKRKQDQRFPDNLGRLCVPPVCTGAGGPAQADSAEW